MRLRLVAWALAAADEPPQSAEPPRLRRASAIFGDPVMPEAAAEVLLRTFGRPDDLTLGRPGRALVKSPDLAQNPGAFLDGDGGLVLFGGEDDAANPDGPSANTRRGVGVVATRFAEPESFVNGTEPTLVLRGSHAGCVEAREHWGGVCQFDGKLTPFRWRDRILLYARANTALKGGGRALQVAAAPAPEGPFGAFEPVTFEGYAGVGFRDANVYFGSVAPNPVDGGSVLGLFPVNAAAGRFDPPARRNVSCLALAVSCDGAHFSKLDCFLKSPAEAEGRTADHPATGFVVSDGSVHLYAHRNARGRFLFAGHVRTLRHTADSIVAHALETFGGDAFTFVVASDEDPGSSHGFLGPGDADAARAALARLRPRRAFFGTLGNDTRPALRAGCELPGDDQVKTSARSANAGGSRAEALFQTWARVGRCFALMSDYEVKHDAALVPRYGRRDHGAGFQFRYVVRLRLDATFFEPLRFTACDLDAAGDEGRTGPSAAHAQAFFPLGVAGCTLCANQIFNPTSMPRTRRC
ncbi:ligase [Aureococcus anophagefferens]|nr:ligase [Aureococcus anophagefferens]